MKVWRKLPIGFGLFLVFLALFADFLSPNAPGMQNLEQFYHPPTPLHISAGRLFIYETELDDPLQASYRQKGESPHRLQFFYRGYRYNFLGLIPMDRHLVGRSSEPLFYPMGTDELGRDVLARVLAGTRTSLLVVALGLAVYVIVGGAIGACAGMFGGWVDSCLMRFSEFVLALPALYLVLAMRAVVPMHLGFGATLLLIVGTIAAVAWPPMARGIRGLVLQLRSAGYIEAARSLGAGPLYILRRHMLPSLLPFVLSQLVVAAPIFLLGEVVLSFLDVGFRDSGESWGAMLRNLKDMRVLTDFWWNLLPLGMIFLTLLCLNLLSGGPGGGKQEERAFRL